MRRVALSMMVALGLMAASPAFAREGAAQETKSHLSPTMETILLWVNFAVLMGGLGYLTKKYGTPFLVARSEKISHDIVDAARVRKEAEERAAEVDRRLANLESELAAIREESQKEIETQRRHLAERSAAEIGRIQEHAEQEVAAAGKLARLDLKRYSAELAIALAAQKIQARMTPGAQDELVQGFVKSLDHPAANAQTN